MTWSLFGFAVQCFNEHSLLFVPRLPLALLAGSKPLGGCLLEAQTSLRTWQARLVWPLQIWKGNLVPVSNKGIFEQLEKKKNPELQT